MNDSMALIQLMLADGLGARTLSRILARVASENCRLSEFVSAHFSEMTGLFQIKAETAASIKNNYDRAVEIFHKLENQGIMTLIKGSKGYPQRLSAVLMNAAPPVLFAHGNSDLLNKNSVGFCGSRHASNIAIETTNYCSSILAKKGINIVSGYAPGIDSVAHSAALRTGGSTTIVLATGILNFSGKSEIFESLDEQNHLVISEFLPTLGWAAHNAMQRNLTICGLSNAIVVIESRLEGGTFEAGKAALKLNCPLFVVDYRNLSSTAKGNEYLIANGGRPIRHSEDGLPDLTEVLDAINNSEKHRSQTSFLQDFGQ